ncbi:hypothetical protein [Phenylobacterium sp.]|uniref:hypothetical protein n=1 Tax=Phenylobacterium sp. TaxID=1871053 RepID=UPI00374DF0A5
MMVVAAAVCAANYAGFSFASFSAAMLMAAVVVSAIAWSFARATEQGLASMTGQQFAMTGWMSVIWNIAASVPYFGAYLLGGLLS